MKTKVNKAAGFEKGQSITYLGHPAKIISIYRMDYGFKEVPTFVVDYVTKNGRTRANFVGLNTIKAV